MTLAAWLHDLSPFVFRISGSFGLRWYGLAYAIGFVIGYFILRALAKRRLVLIPPERVLDALMLIVAGVVVGGRLGYVLLYEPSLLWSFSPDLPWWGVLQLQRGGMASHGGMVGVIVACWWISRGWKNNQGQIEDRCPLLHVLDAMVLAAPPGLMLGRIANFINGELLGRIVAGPGEPAPWWAVRFPQEVLSGHAPKLTVEQTQRLMALVDRVALPSESFSEGYGRLLRKIQAGSTELGDQLAPLLSARHPSQLYQAFAEGIVLGVVLWWIWRRPRLPGVVGCWFLIVYGVLRITTEYWRLPDAHLARQRIMGLSRGQWFSAIMVIAGLGLLYWIIRRGGQRLGGWASLNKTNAEKTNAEVAEVSEER
jgi:phosphatidylglycerol:prolipoprotein diacylglycerol transferase